MIKHSIFLNWWWKATLIVIASVILVYSNSVQYLWNNDVTKISFIILGVFFITTIFCGIESWKLSKLKNNEIEAIPNLLARHEPGWFAADACQSLGLIGTVSGFLLLLVGAFSELDINNITSVQNSMKNMSLGMGTALLTTLVGVTCSLILKYQFFGLDQALERHLDEQQASK